MPSQPHKSSSLSLKDGNHINFLELRKQRAMSLAAETTTMCCLTFWRRMCPTFRCQQGCVFLLVVKKKLPHASPLASGGFRVICGTRCLWEHHLDLCLHLHMTFSCIRSCVQIYPFFKDTSHSDSGPSLLQYDLILTNTLQPYSQ